MNDRNGVEMESTHLLIGFYAGHHKEYAWQKDRRVRMSKFWPFLKMEEHFVEDPLAQKVRNWNMFWTSAFFYQFSNRLILTCFRWSDGRRWRSQLKLFHPFHLRPDLSPLSQCELKWGDPACEMDQPSSPCEIADPGGKINSIEISFLWRRPLELLL